MDGQTYIQTSLRPLVYIDLHVYNNRLSLIVACQTKNYRRSIEPKPRMLAAAINTSDLQWRAVRFDYRPGHAHCSEIACGNA
jgi:hypothetical protein